jgi:hypothetical protein
MRNELHIRMHPEIVDPPEDILSEFPFESGQSIVSCLGDLVVIDLGEEEDTNDIQDWFLNSLDDVLSFYVVGD